MPPAAERHRLKKLGFESAKLREGDFDDNSEEDKFVTPVERIEGEVQNLTADELRAFREWFARFDAAAWDEQIEADAVNGRLDSLAERAIQDHQAGRSTLL